MLESDKAYNDKSGRLESRSSSTNDGLSAKRLAAEAEVAAELESIELALQNNTPLEDILNLPATAAGGDPSTGSSVTTAVRFTYSGGQVIPETGFNTTQAQALARSSVADEQAPDTQVDAIIDLHIVDGGDELISESEAPSILIQGIASGIEAAPGTIVSITITDQSGNQVSGQATVGLDGGYQYEVDLSSFNDGDSVTAVATLTDVAGNTLSAVDDSLLDLTYEVQLQVNIDDGGDELINQSERTAVSVTGSIVGGEVTAGSVVTLKVGDQSGHVLNIDVVIDADGNFQTTTDLSDFTDGDLVTAVARSADAAGNAVTAQDTSRLDTGVNGALTVEIIDGGDERLNSAEVDEVTISGAVNSPEINPGDIVSLTVTDQSGNRLDVTAVIDANGRYQTVADLSSFGQGDLVTATAAITDPAGNILNASDTSVIDAVYDGGLSVEIIDGGDELVNIGDEAGVIISGSVTGSENLNLPVTLTLTDQSGNSISTEAIIDSSGNYATTVDLSGFQAGDLVTVLAQHQDASGNIITANDTSTLELIIISPVLTANNDNQVFHGQTMSGNILLGDGGVGADVLTANGKLSQINYRGLDIDLSVTVIGITATGSDGSTFVYSVLGDTNFSVRNTTDLSRFILESVDGNYFFLAGTRDVLQNEVITYTLSNDLGETDSATLTLEVPTEGIDIITGTDLAGGDTIIALGGNDTIDAGAGADQVFAGSGYDTVHGGDGNDIIDGGTGFDQLYGDAGNDAIIGGGGRDRLYGGDGKDTLSGGAWDDLLRGDDGDDKLMGGNGMDIILGGAGNDTINGGRFDDSISGGDGNDFIQGGRGADVMAGGSGNDEFYFSHSDNGSSAVTNEDTIYDFSVADDVINLSDLLINYDPAAGDDITDFLDINFASVAQLTANTDIDNSTEAEFRSRIDNGVTDTIILIDEGGNGSFSGNTQEIVLVDIDLSSYGSNEAEILQNLISSGILLHD